MGCSNRDGLCDLMLAEGDAAAFAAVAFLALVLLAVGPLDAGDSACEENHRRACCWLGANLMAGPRFLWLIVALMGCRLWYPQNWLHLSCHCLSEMARVAAGEHGHP